MNIFANTLLSFLMSFAPRGDMMHDWLDKKMKKLQMAGFEPTSEMFTLPKRAEKTFREEKLQTAVLQNRFKRFASGTFDKKLFHQLEGHLSEKLKNNKNLATKCNSCDRNTEIYK